MPLLRLVDCCPLCYNCAPPILSLSVERGQAKSKAGQYGVDSTHPAVPSACTRSCPARLSLSRRVQATLSHKSQRSSSMQAGPAPIPGALSQEGNGAGSTRRGVGSDGTRRDGSPASPCAQNPRLKKTGKLYLAQNPWAMDWPVRLHGTWCWFISSHKSS